jgi:hypothetical protein
MAGFNTSALRGITKLGLLVPVPRTPIPNFAQVCAPLPHPLPLPLSPCSSTLAPRPRPSSLALAPRPCPCPCPSPLAPRPSPLASPLAPRPSLLSPPLVQLPHPCSLREWRKSVCLSNRKLQVRKPMLWFRFLRFPVMLEYVPFPVPVPVPVPVGPWCGAPL